MDEQLAQSILQQWQTAPLQPAKEGERHPIGEEPGKGRRQHGKRHAKGKIKESPRKKAKPSKEKIEETPDKRVRPAEGPPIQVSYKGETRALHDGAGLCSPGRWPVDRRRLPVTEREKSTVAWFEDAFETWLKEVGVEEAKQIFWSMAAGRVKQSPFEKGIDEARRALDQHLARWGLEPCRIAEDRPSEINFRRLRALAEALSDEDFGFLEEVAARGVRLGVDLEMPRTPAVYEEKVKWTVDATDEIMRDMLAENYESAEENAEDIARQVLHEVEIGTIVRMMEHEARRKYKGRLAVAALGAVPKELGTKKVRLIHDGTYSVDVNRRIRVRDRMRFPLIDDATAVLRQVEHELDGSQGAIRFSVLYDIARAHKLIPVDEEDWGLQAFRLPGDKSGDIFVRTRGTFGVASAAYWFGRAISVAVRCVHRLLGRRYGLLHLIYADDGWLTATGREFWKKILMWFFTFELLEIPVTWSKVRGGTEVNWIGYCLNVHTFQKGHQPVEENMDRRLDRSQRGARRCARARAQIGAGAAQLRCRGAETRPPVPGPSFLVGFDHGTWHFLEVPRCCDDFAGLHTRGGEEKANEACRAAGEVPCGHLQGGRQGGRGGHRHRWLGNGDDSRPKDGQMVLLSAE